MSSANVHINDLMNLGKEIQWQDIENNGLLNFIIDKLPEGIIIADANATIIKANQRFCDIFELNIKSGQSLKGLPLSSLFETISHLWPNIAAEQSKLTDPALKMQNQIGDIIHLNNGKIITRDYVPLITNNTFQGHLCVITDSTQTLKAEAEKEQQRRFYEEILNSIPADLVVFSQHHEYLFINPVSVKNPDMRKWLINKTDYDYCKYTGRDIAIADKRRAIFNQVVTTRMQLEWEETVTNALTGKIEHHLRRMTPIYNEKDELTLVLGWGIDITDRKEIERRIQLNEKKYRDIFNYSQAIIATHNIEGYILSTNPAMLETLGYAESEILGKNIQDFIPEEDTLLFEDTYLNTILVNKKQKGLMRVYRKDGSKAYLLYQNYLLDNPGEEPYIISFAQDVTDRIKVEKELKEAKRVSEETARIKERFLANMSHEIRTPMNGILGITKLLQKSTNLTEEQSDYLKIIQDCSRNLINIINDILDLEKIGSGNIEFEKVPFDLVDSLNTNIKLFRVTAEMKNISMQFENKLGNKLEVLGDPTRFSQIINNLLSNAVKFTHKGGISVTGSIIQEQGDQITVQISVKDTGIGIDQNKLIKIFQPFTQAYPETARKYGGTGLGLAITRNLLDMQGGKIWVESHVKEGSTFHFTLPYKRTNSLQKQMQSTIQTEVVNKLGTLKVLLAEDNPINQMLATRILDYWGFVTEIANDGKEAIAKVTQGDFDLILMDIQMPEMNGLEATRAIRSLNDPSIKNIPIIALTANALKGEESQYFDAGMNGYLIKPFKENELYDVIASVIKPLS
ncbi:MAG: PAS domain S-box protein [Chitinophagaceae bacterium]